MLFALGCMPLLGGADHAERFAPASTEVRNGGRHGYEQDEHGERHSPELRVRAPVPYLPDAARRRDDPEAQEEPQEDVEEGRRPGHPRAPDRRAERPRTGGPIGLPEKERPHEGDKRQPENDQGVTALVEAFGAEHLLPAAGTPTRGGAVALVVAGDAGAGLTRGCAHRNYSWEEVSTRIARLASAAQRSASAARTGGGR